MRLKKWLALGVGVSVMAGSAMAQTWPQKPVRLVVSFPAGAPGDTIARLIQPELQKELGQPVVVENRPGAGGNIGAQEVARSTDQHTFLVGPDTMFTINPHVYKKMGFSPLDDLKPLTLLASFNQMLACHPSVGVKTLSGFVAKAKSQAMNYASGGPGVPGHMAMEMLMAETQLRMDHVPYKGPAPAMQDVLAGQVPCGFLAAPAVGPQAKGGKLTALAVSGARRSPGSPEIPTVAEQGIKDFDASFFETLSAPKNVSAAAAERMQMAVTKVLEQADVKAKLLQADMEVVANSSAEAQQRLRADHLKWGRVASKIHLQLD